MEWRDLSWGPSPDRVVREGSAEAGFELSPDDKKGPAMLGCRGHVFPGRGNSKCKVPEVGTTSSNVTEQDSKPVWQARGPAGITGQVTQGCNLGED